MQRVIETVFTVCRFYFRPARGTLDAGAPCADTGGSLPAATNTPKLEFGTNHETRNLLRLLHRPAPAGRHRRHQCPLRAETAPQQIEAIWSAECAAYPTLGAALVHYLAQPATVAAGGYQARLAGIAIANPIDGDWVRMTNHHWSFSIEAV